MSKDARQEVQQDFLATAARVLRNRRGNEYSVLLHNCIQAPDAEAAVTQGGNVLISALRHDKFKDEEIDQLETHALHGPANIRASEGENVKKVAKKCGIFTPAKIRVLESYAVNGAAGDKVRQGADYLQVAREHGIEDEGNIHELSQRRPMERATLTREERMSPQNNIPPQQWEN
jgi:hypothetical protein